VSQAAAVTKLDQAVFQAAYALAALPARYALERRRWSEAAALPLRRPATFPWDRFRYAEAITHFARAIGSARRGDVPGARIAVAKLAEIAAALPRNPGEYDWKSQVEAQRLAASAWLAHAEGSHQAALEQMRAAADLEDRTEKHPVTPGAILPAREMLGELFLELNQPAQALPEFEAVLRAAPGRFNAAYGAGRAAELSGNSAVARAHYGELVQLCEKSDAERLELQNARAFLGKRR
jgi:tetratricopeptide (TPR) repeat protein